MNKFGPIVDPGLVLGLRGFEPNGTLIIYGEELSEDSFRKYLAISLDTEGSFNNFRKKKQFNWVIDSMHDGYLLTLGRDVLMLDEVEFNKRLKIMDNNPVTSTLIKALVRGGELYYSHDSFKKFLESKKLAL